MLEAIRDHVLADAGGDDERADVVLPPESFGAMKSASATLARPSRRASCWRSVCSTSPAFDQDIVAVRIRRPEADDRRGA